MCWMVGLALYGLAGWGFVSGLRMTKLLGPFDDTAMLALFWPMWLVALVAVLAYVKTRDLLQK